LYFVLMVIAVLEPGIAGNRTSPAADTAGDSRFRQNRMHGLDGSRAEQKRLMPGASCP